MLSENMIHGTVDFLVMHTDGRITRHARGDMTMGDAVRGFVVRPAPGAGLGTQGMGRLRAFYDDDFAGTSPALPQLAPNPLADTALRGIGYMQPHGFWRGDVALCMESDAHGEYNPMPAAVVATLEELAAGVAR
jgi:hypothetical protein